MPTQRFNGLAGLSSLVYSTDTGRICPDCEQAAAQCRCAALKAQARALAAQGDGVVRVSRTSKGRGGKTVSLVHGVPLDATGVAALAKSLKTTCGTGGCVKDGVIELQGDHVDLLLKTLAAHGWTVRRSGG